MRSSEAETKGFDKRWIEAKELWEVTLPITSPCWELAVMAYLQGKLAGINLDRALERTLWK
jgi:hypothetical protein